MDMDNAGWFFVQIATLSPLRLKPFLREIIRKFT